MYEGLVVAVAFGLQRYPAVDGIVSGLYKEGRVQRLFFIFYHVFQEALHIQHTAFGSAGDDSVGAGNTRLLQAVHCRTDAHLYQLAHAAYRHGIDVLIVLRVYYIQPAVIAAHHRLQEVIPVETMLRRNGAGG